MADLADTRVSLAGLGALQGVALTASASGACIARVGGIEITARVVTGLTVAASDQLLLLRRGPTYWAIAKAPAAPSSAPTPPAAGSGPDGGDTSPDPKPTITTGKLVCAPVATATYRDGVWRTDIGPVNSADTYQGRYSGSSYGRMTGCAFYGSAPRTLAGATVTGATLQVRRLTAGDYAARTATLRLVSQSTRPSGAPTLNETTSGPSLAVGATNNSFAIPTSWAQAMVDSTRGGLAISISTDSPYIRLAGRASWSAAWTLTIAWRRG
ncbi:hypothetical protein OG393_31075 [Streptomyces sp. NBC_01216]|uniref:hypothetical protein n=1 Tax=Streptomyces sp. NBC_01216 TaxID=2903778 RepID=UPI002E0F5D65|nr:hypothetical protein OG393_31075 [Streptomyces sp. NBC_01216]